MTFRFAFLTAASLALALGAASQASAADAAKEAATAAQHAGMAANATNIGTAHTHLHHVVNCLVGPKGENYDAKQFNPCAKLGNGAIPDTTDAAAKAKLEKAVASAEAGIKSNDLKTATNDASEAEAALK